MLVSQPVGLHAMGLGGKCIMKKILIKMMQYGKFGCIH